MEELITIIIPIYQVEKYLRKCIDSVLSQTYKNLEIILVDDGSTDSSPEICEYYQKKDSRIKVIHKENGGLSDARNAGMKIATGKYIGFIDSDDYIKSDMYQVLYENIVKTNADISICDFLAIKESDANYNREERKQDINEYNTIEALRLLIENKIRSYAWNKLYKRELLEGIQFPKGKKMEDLAVMYKIFEKAEKVVYTNKTEYYYLQRSSSILGNIDMQLTNDLYEFVTERYQYIIRKYPELRESLNIDRIRYILIYHKNIALLSNKKAYKENKLITEYLFFKEVFKKYKNVICFNIGIMSKLEYKLLYFSRGLFFRYYQVKKILKKAIKKK